MSSSSIPGTYNMSAVMDRDKSLWIPAIYPPYSSEELALSNTSALAAMNPLQQILLGLSMDIVGIHVLLCTIACLFVPSTARHISVKFWISSVVPYSVVSSMIVCRLQKAGPDEPEIIVLASVFCFLLHTIVSYCAHATTAPVIVHLSDLDSDTGTEDNDASATLRNNETKESEEEDGDADARANHIASVALLPWNNVVRHLVTVYLIWVLYGVLQSGCTVSLNLPMIPVLNVRMICYVWHLWECILILCGVRLLILAALHVGQWMTYRIALARRGM